uniref:Uncharacterized protein n=1 Tax=Globodera pallida TaxID=36090 RepID=A0A183CET5_GLOPA
MWPNILHIEKISELRRLDGLHDQFHYRTGSEDAIAYECRRTIRQFLDGNEFKQYENTIRQKAEQGTQIGQHLLTKLNMVKQKALSKEKVISPKGICMLVKLREFMRGHCQRTALLREDDSDLKRIEEWWPNKCYLKAEVENVFRTQQFVFQQQNRKMYTERFMGVWRALVTVRGAPTRLFKFFQLSERQIELEWINNNKGYTDPNVFRSFNLLESHYIEALTTLNPAQHKAAKLAADIFIWALWLEGGVLESNKCKELDKMPRFNMGWKQNRWYYEMVYDQLFDIEKANEQDELEKKGQEIGILLQLSKKFVDEKLKVPDEKLKIEIRSKKLERLAIKNGMWPPPVGTLDKEWYEIRRKSESRKEIVGQEFEHWMQQLHFTILKERLSKCYKFNKEFFDQSFGVKMRVAEFVGNAL